MNGGINTKNTALLIEQEVLSNRLKEIFQDEFGAAQFVDVLQGFDKGDEFLIPSVGDLVASDYNEGEEVTYQDIATGMFKFRITEYLQSGTFITNKMEQDSMYAETLKARLPEKEARSILQRFEADVFKLQGEQKAGDANKINGIAHRFICTGMSNAATPVADYSLTLKDFAFAKLALKKARVPLVNLTAVVPSEAAYRIETDMLDKGKLIYNPKWEGIIADGFYTGFMFKYQVDGFDVYVSEYLDDIKSEKIGTPTVTNAKAAVFFANIPGDRPFITSWRQAPRIESKYNQDLQRTEYLTTARYGLGLQRPENLVVGLTTVAID